MNWLGYKEPEVWLLTPRKFSALITVHVDIQKQLNSASSTKSPKKPTSGYIDQIKGW